jgi:hypothetical protein
LGQKSFGQPIINSSKTSLEKHTFYSVQRLVVAKIEEVWSGGGIRYA